MPFRLSKEYRNLLDQHKRTGEPFPAFYAVGEIRDKAHGKADGSFTKSMRSALEEWIKAQTGLPQGQIQFDYKLYRHKIVHVAGYNAYLRHDHLRGIGLKGFVLELTVLSIDGIPYMGLDRRGAGFAWNRIIGRDKILMLPAVTEREPGNTP